MSLKTFVKIGKIDNLSDARYCAGMMADILGFNLEEGTEGYISPEKFKEITDWVAGVKFCGEFARAQAAEIKLATSTYTLDFIEVQDIELLEELSELKISLILKIVLNGPADLSKLDSLAYASEFVSYIVIQAPDASLSESIHQALTSQKPTTPILCAYGLTKSSVVQTAQEDLFFGIELEGSPEDRPGFKDYGAVMDILEELEED